MSVPAFIRDRLPRIAALCDQHGVEKLWLFGSAVDPSDGQRPFDPSLSDVDLLVQFRPMPAGGLSDAYFSLRESLEALFARRVDLVTVASLTNPYFRASVEQTRVPLYAAA